MKKLIISIVMIFLTVVLSGEWVNATPMIDQQQPVIVNTVGGVAIGGTYEEKLAQVVTSGISGVLTEVRFPVACSSGDLVVEIQGVNAEGQPNGVVLTSQTIPGTSLPSFFPEVASFRSLPLSAPVSFSAGDRFAIVLSSAGECGVFQGPIGDSYSEGNAYFDARPNQKGVWVCICNFAGERFDLPFQTIVAPFIQVSISPTSHDFGSVIIGNTSAPQTFTILNTGIEDFSIGTITLTDTTPSEFYILNDNCSGQTWTDTDFISKLHY